MNTISTTFDFEIVRRQIIRMYRQSNLNGDRTWTLDAVLEIFQYFYSRYTDNFGVDHPRLKSATILTIINSLPFFDEGMERPLDPDDYYDLIDSYFQQDFKRCNYSMSHFMSGDIRLYRVYETM